MHEKVSVVEKFKRSRLGHALVAGATVVGASACLPAPEAPAPVPAEINGEPTSPNGMSARVLGDSLIFGGANDQRHDNSLREEKLVTALHQSGYKADVQAMTGAVTADLNEPDMYPATEQVTDKTALAFGTNDRHQGYDANGDELIPVPVNEAVNSLITYMNAADSSCYALIGIAETPQWGLDITGPDYNDALQTLADDTPGIMFYDWAEQVAADPSIVNPKDGVHFTEEGKAVYRAFVVGAVEGCNEVWEGDIALPPEPVITEPQFGA